MVQVEELFVGGAVVEGPVELACKFRQFANARLRQTLGDGVDGRQPGYGRVWGVSKGFIFGMRYRKFSAKESELSIGADVLGLLEMLLLEPAEKKEA